MLSLIQIQQPDPGHLFVHLFQKNKMMMVVVKLVDHQFDHYLQEHLQQEQERQDWIQVLHYSLDPWKYYSDDDDDDDYSDDDYIEEIFLYF